jgi:hypothetical protein
MGISVALILWHKIMKELFALSEKVYVVKQLYVVIVW